MRGLVVRTTIPVPVAVSVVSGDLVAVVLQGGEGAEVHLGLVSVVGGASVASVDGVVASVALAGGRAETLVRGARVVAQGGVRGAGEVAQRERASAGDRHAEEGAGEEDARARGGGSAGVAAGAAHGPEGRASGGGSRRERAGATARARARGSEETRRGVPTPTRNPRRTTGVVRNETRAREDDPRVTREGRVRGRGRTSAVARARSWRTRVCRPNRARTTGIFKRDERRGASDDHAQREWR